MLLLFPACVVATQVLKLSCSSNNVQISIISMCVLPCVIVQTHTHTQKKKNRSTCELLMYQFGSRWFSAPSVHVCLSACAHGMHACTYACACCWRSLMVIIMKCIPDDDLGTTSRLSCSDCHRSHVRCAWVHIHAMSHSAVHHDDASFRHVHGPIARLTHNKNHNIQQLHIVSAKVFSGFHDRLNIPRRANGGQ